MRECSGGKHEVIEDGEADDRAGRDDDGDAVPDAQARAMLGAEFGLERFGETQEAEAASRAGALRPSVFGDEFFVGAMLPSLRGPPWSRDCFVCVRQSRRNCRARISPRSGLTRVRLSWRRRLHARAPDFERAPRLLAAPRCRFTRAAGEIPSSFAAVVTANSSRCCSV